MELLLPHIAIGLDKDRVVLEVQDCELSDFIEDYLTEECELVPEAIRNSNKDGREVVTHYFDPSISLSQVKEALMKLSQTEIESVYRVNNPC